MSFNLYVRCAEVLDSWGSSTSTAVNSSFYSQMELGLFCILSKHNYHLLPIFNQSSNWGACNLLNVISSYPSGRPAISIVASDEKGLFSYIVTEDLAENGKVLAVFQHTGCGTTYFPTGAIRWVILISILSWDFFIPLGSFYFMAKFFQSLLRSVGWCWTRCPWCKEAKMELER